MSFIHQYSFYTIEETSPIKDLPDFARKKGISYKALKLYNPWLRDNKITGRAGRVYSFKIPVKKDP
jgi:membrane-bound lytic murein transglycosylase D